MSVCSRFVALFFDLKKSGDHQQWRPVIAPKRCQAMLDRGCLEAWLAQCVALTRQIFLPDLFCGLRRNSGRTCRDPAISFKQHELG